MIQFFEGSRIIRKHFGKEFQHGKIPSLSESYLQSYDAFLQAHVSPELRKNQGLEAVLRSVFPIESRRLPERGDRIIDGQSSKDLYFYSHYIIQNPLYKEEDCRIKGLSYLTSIYIVAYKVRIKGDRPLSDISGYRSDVNLIEKELVVLPIKGIPLITDKGTFIINGIERAIVSQLQRAPGVYDIRKKGVSGLKLIPYYGTSIQFEKGPSEKLYVRISGKRRIPLFTFLHSLGITKKEFIALFYNIFYLYRTSATVRISFDLKKFLHGRVLKDIHDTRTGEVVLRKGTYISDDIWLQLMSCTILNQTLDEKLLSNLTPTDFYNSSSRMRTCHTAIQAFKKYSPEVLEVYHQSLRKNDMRNKLLEYIRLGDLESDCSSLQKVIDLVRGHATSLNTREKNDFLQRTFLNPIYYNLSFQGREKLNEALDLFEEEHLTLTKIDFLAILKSLVDPDYRIYKKSADMYSLQNRKIKLPGELFSHLILKALLFIKRRKEYSTKFYLSGALLPLPSIVNQRIIDIFACYRKLNISHNLLVKLLQNKIYLLSETTDKLHQLLLIMSKKQIDYFLTGSNLSQLLDQLNPLAELTHIRRVSLLGPGGLGRDNVSLDTRDVQTSFFGRICPIETPEGKSVGIVNSLTLVARISDSGDILAPYIKVINGRLSSTVDYLDPKEEQDHYIALIEEKYDISGRFLNTWVYGRYKGRFGYINAEKIDYVDFSSRQILSLSSALIPFVEHNDGNRALMGSNMQRQAVTNIISEGPIIGTGVEYFSRTESNIKSKAKSRVAWVDNQTILLSDTHYLNHIKISLRPVLLNFGQGTTGIARTLNHLLSTQWNQINLSQLPLKLKGIPKFEKANQKSYLHYQPIVKKGALIQKNTVLADPAGSHLGDISLGHNILVGFMSMNGYSFEDSIVISERLNGDSLYNSVHTKELIVFDWDSNSSKERITKNIPNMPTSQLKNLDPSGVIKVGTAITGNDILVGKILVDRRGKSHLSERDRFLQGLIAGEGENKDYIKDTSERAPVESDGYVLDVKKFFFSSGGLTELVYRKQKNKIVENYHTYRIGQIISTFFILQKIRDLILNSTPISNTLQNFEAVEFRETSQNSSGPQDTLIGFLLGYHDLEFSNMVVSNLKRMKLLSLISGSTRDLIQTCTDSLILNLISINQNTKALYKIKKLAILFSYIKKDLKALWYKKHLVEVKNSIYLETPRLPLRLVKILLATKHKLKPGDKMTGRHGNKGVISQILPRDEMPYLKDGTPLDIILNPIGISSRMNLGQVFEVHLGWSSSLLGRTIYELLKKNSRDYTYQDLRNYLYHLYGTTKEQAIISKLSKKEIEVLGTRLSRAIPIATPTFDGATEEDLNDMFSMSNLNILGQTEILDGKTGEQFDKPVTVGYMYVMKLNHLVDDKIHARFTGPYNRVTEQPLGGKSLHGGQRLGEMEVWALQAYGAAHTLLDMITVKSDFRSRKRDRKSSVKDFPEAFNVLLRELWCLGLNITLNTQR